MIRRTLIFITLIAASASMAAADLIVLGPPIPLSDLIGGGPLTVGDKVFTKFFYSATEDMPSADAVNVIPIQADGNFGIRFQGGFVDLPGGSTSDALITYTVTVADTNRLISDAHLVGNVDLFGGEGLGSVTETFLPEFPSKMLTIYDDGTNVDLTDWLDFDPPVAMLNVQKNIVLLARDGSVSATMSFVDQTFSQVPEPTTVTFLLLAAIGGLVLRGRC